VAALLELGSGFNPEFTGRDNIIHYGTVLGLGQSELQARLDGIIEFADIGPHIDQPIKTYSTGMLVRLAFAVASSIDAEIFIIDEALAVGDVFFRQKCYKRLEELRAKDVTILFVSHDLVGIQQLCGRALLLDAGAVHYCGAAPAAVNQLLMLEQSEIAGVFKAPILSTAVEAIDGLAAGSTEANQSPTMSWPPPEKLMQVSAYDQVSNGEAVGTYVGICDQRGDPKLVFEQGETASFFYEFEVRQPVEVPIGGMIIRNDKNIIVHGKNSFQFDTEMPRMLEPGDKVRFRQDIKLELAPGEYTFEPGFARITLDDYALRRTVSHEDLTSATVRVCNFAPPIRFAIAMRPVGVAASQLLHHGVANLASVLGVSIVKGETVAESYWNDRLLRQEATGAA
jgi:lipopolysaccharide transport system ATP-binding protein